MSLKMVLFLGSCREGRMGERVMKMVMARLEARKHEVTLLDPRELEEKGISLLKQAMQFYPDPKQVPPILQDLNKKIVEADALVFVTAEYNAGCPPAMLNLIDHFPPESYSFKPAGIVSYSLGPFGGIRAAAALRLVLSEIGTIHSQAACTIPTVSQSVSESGEPNERVSKNIEKTLNYLEWYADALKAKKAKSGLPELH